MDPKCNFNILIREKQREVEEAIVSMQAETGVMGPAAAEAGHRTVHVFCYKTVSSLSKSGHLIPRKWRSKGQH